jgi:hypothetical protein
VSVFQTGRVFNGGSSDIGFATSLNGGVSWTHKNWTVCDNTLDSPFYGNCYTKFDNASSGDLELMSTSSDGGLTWGAPTPTADSAHGLGGQPVVQPSGRVVVPYEGLTGASGIRAFTSDDGGAT